MNSTEIRNWAGNITFHPQRLHRPTSIPELQEIVASARQARALGGAYSFNRIADTTGELIAVDQLPSVPVIDRERMTVAVSAGTRYGDLSAYLHENGLALSNLASLPQISVAGACITGTHGSGNDNGSLPSAVRSVTLVTAQGELVTLNHGEPGFGGAVVSLGALGIVTSMSITVCPTFDVEQYVFDGLSWDTLLTQFDSITASGYSVSVFSHFNDANRIWLKHRCGDPRGDLTHTRVRPAQTPQHPLVGLAADNCTDQLGVAGPWHERLPHFRPHFVPATGNELQSEYFLPRAQAPAALESLYRIRDRFSPILQICEIRTVAADDCWLSQNYQRDTVAIHFAWRPDMSLVMSVLPDIERALAPGDPRPHWGKLFTMDAAALRASYPKWDEFDRLAKEFDPAGKFRNDAVNSYFPR
ncbi:MAG: FAD-binding protein [Mycobacteriaceae bacterium]|nr:FAD-binding protein [Mycobacteriaceae bacterium]